jgi:hypothetical protein
VKRVIQAELSHRGKWQGGEKPETRSAGIESSALPHIRQVEGAPRVIGIRGGGD